MSAELKQSIRGSALKKRDSIPLPVRRIKDSAIREKAAELPVFKDGGGILFYASFRSEADTFALMRDALSAGKRVFLPRVEGEGLGIYEIKSVEELSPGYMGIPEPAATAPVGLDEAVLVVVPGAAFDERGFRLGYGKGYYDRLLSGGRRPLLVALAYEEQIVGAVPGEPHDVAVDIIVTDRRVIRCKK